MTLLGEEINLKDKNVKFKIADLINKNGINLKLFIKNAIKENVFQDDFKVILEDMQNDMR